VKRHVKFYLRWNKAGMPGTRENSMFCLYLW